MSHPVRPTPSGVRDAQSPEGRRIRDENRRIAHERDEYARRLELARAKLDELRGVATLPD